MHWQHRIPDFQVKQNIKTSIESATVMHYDYHSKAYLIYVISAGGQIAVQYKDSAAILVRSWVYQQSNKDYTLKSFLKDSTRRKSTQRFRDFIHNHQI